MTMMMILSLLIYSWFYVEFGFKYVYYYLRNCVLGTGCTKLDIKYFCLTKIEGAKSKLHSVIVPNPQATYVKFLLNLSLSLYIKLYNLDSPQIPPFSYLKLLPLSLI